MRTSAGAFVGRLDRVVPDGPDRPKATFLFRVERRYKGSFGRRVSVRSHLEGATCGLGDLRRRDRIGLFLLRNRRTGRLESNLCLVVTPSEMRRAARGSSSALAGRCR